VAVLAAFASGLGSTLRVVLEVAPAHMATFLAGLGSTLWVFREIAFTAAMFSNLVYVPMAHLLGENEGISVQSFLMT
jgi:hypothetical protein